MQINKLYLLFNSHEYQKNWRYRLGKLGAPLVFLASKVLLFMGMIKIKILPANLDKELIIFTEV